MTVIEKPFVSIVFVTYNGKKDMAECLESLEKQTYTHYEIIAVDNNSTDDIVPYLESIPDKVQLINTKKNNGFGAGNNIGIEKAKGDMIVITNYDAVYDPYWLEYLVTSALQNPDAGIIVPKILLYHDKNTINTCGVFISYFGYVCSNGLGKKTDEFNSLQTLASASGCSFLIKKNTLTSIGAFDEEYHRFGKRFFFSSLEDIDLSWRTLLIGQKILLDPRALMYHKYYQKPLTVLRYLYLECGRYYLLLKNYKAITLIVLSPALFVFECMSIAFALIKGHKFFISKLISYVILFKKLPAIIKQRHAIALLRTTQDSQILDPLGSDILLRHINLPSGFISIGERMCNKAFGCYKSIAIKILLTLEKSPRK